MLEMFTGFFVPAFEIIDTDSNLKTSNRVLISDQIGDNSQDE